MAKYVDIQNVINFLCYYADESCASVIKEAEDILGVDVVPRETFDQVRWERDTALAQLRELGFELGHEIPRCETCGYCEEMLVSNCYGEEIHIDYCNHFDTATGVHKDYYCSEWSEDDD